MREESFSWLCRAAGLCSLLLIPTRICGQPPAAETTRMDLCLLCLDGSAPLRTEDLLDEGRFGPEVSCASLLPLSEGLLNCSSNDFFALQLTLIQANCCPDVSNSSCSLCPDGSNEISFPSRMLPSPLTTANNLTSLVVSCGDLVNNETIHTAFLSEFEGEPGVCENTLVRRSAAYCGCPSTEPVCDLCNGGSLISEEEFNLTNTSCSEIAFGVSLLPQGQCQNQNQSSGFDTAALCCENVERPNQCYFCDVQEQLVPMKMVTTDSWGEVTCAALQDAATLATTDAVCQSLRDDAGVHCCIQRAEGSTTCELTCPDGTMPPDPFKRDRVTGYSCQDLAMEFAQFPVNECDKDAISYAMDFDAVAFCCPSVDPPEACFICPPDEELLYPQRVLFNYEEHTCADLDGSLRHMVNAINCQNILDDSRAKNNCQCRTAIPAPTQAPADGGIMPTPSGTDESGTTRCAGILSMQTMILGFSLASSCLH